MKRLGSFVVAALLSIAAPGIASAQGWRGTPPHPAQGYHPAPGVGRGYVAPRYAAPRYAAPRTFVRPVAPSRAHVWVPGYWGSRRGTRVWIGGAWLVPPYPGWIWIGPQWVWNGYQWVWAEGHWAAPSY